MLSHNPLRLVRDLKSRLGELDRRVTALDSRVGASATQEQVHSLLTAQSNSFTELLNSLNMNVLAASQESAISLVEASTKGVREMFNAMNADLLAYTEQRLAEFAEEYYELLMRSRRAAFAQYKSPSSAALGQSRLCGAAGTEGSCAGAGRGIRLARLSRARGMASFQSGA